MTLDQIIRKAYIVYIASNDKEYNWVNMCDPYTSSEASTLRDSPELMDSYKEAVREFNYPDSRSRIICMYHIGDTV